MVSHNNNKIKNLPVLIALLLCSCSFLFCDGKSVEEDLVLSAKQLKILFQFKQRVLSLLPHDYMKKDAYLIRWLRASNFNLDEAEKTLIENIKWREKEGIDNILNEDWSDMESDFPYYDDGIDNDGRPIISAPMGLWDFRQALISGKSHKMQRYVYGMLEKGEILVRKAQNEGKNVTRFVMLISVKGFNLQMHACLQCIGLYTTVFGNYQSKFPENMDKVWVVDAPQLYQIITNVLIPLMSKETREVFRVFSTNRNEWTEELYKTIDPSELHSEFGGFKQ